MSGGGSVVMCQGGPWPYDERKLVRLIRIESSSPVADVETLQVEDVLTGKRHFIPDYCVDMNKFYNEMEVLAWAASQGDRERS
jgi:hypothetical protein